MFQFVVNHPDYLLIAFLLFFVVVRVIIHIIHLDGSDGSQDDDEGGIFDGSPTLDLPPGVSLPVDSREPEFID